MGKRDFDDFDLFGGDSDEDTVRSIERDLKEGRYEELKADPASLQETRGAYSVVRDFTDLRVWQLGIDFVESIYKATAGFPVDERFGLTNQMRRAAVSVPSNIAEGNARNRMLDYLRFLSIARGSLAEVKTQLVIAERLGFMPKDDTGMLLKQADDILRQLTALYTAVERYKDSKS